MVNTENKDKTLDAISEFLDADFEMDEPENPLVEYEEPLPSSTEVVAVEPTNETKEFKKKALEDFDLARDVLRDTLVNASVTLDRMTELAQQHEDGRFFEVYGQYVKHLTDSAKDMLEIHQKKDALAAFVDTGEAQGEPGQINIEKAVVFSGTTADLQRQLKRQKIEDAEDIEESE